MPETITVKEAADRTGKNERTIRLWLQRGQVDYVRGEDGKRRVVVASLDAHLGGNGATPATTPETLPGLPELVAELALLRKANANLEWLNGNLVAQLEAERQKIRLLEAGPSAPAALPETVPEAVPERPAEPEEPTLWQRIKREVRMWRGMV